MKKVCIIGCFADTLDLLNGQTVKTKIVYKEMKNAFGCVNENIKAFIGPGICMDCYEVSSDVADMFKAAYTKQEVNLLLKNGKTEGKYQLNLLSAN